MVHLHLRLGADLLLDGDRDRAAARLAVDGEEPRAGDVRETLDVGELADRVQVGRHRLGLLGLLLLPPDDLSQGPLRERLQRVDLLGGLRRAGRDGGG
eukprot:9497705-Pyramimonas_sp.AAC.1